MAQTTAQIPTTSSSAAFHYSKPSSQTQIDERRGRYPVAAVQQPDQSSATYTESSQKESRAAHNLLEVTQGLKDLQDKINSALKRSSSAAHVRQPQGVKVSATKQNETQVESIQQTNDSFSQSRSYITQAPSESTTFRYVPSNVSFSALLKENVDGFHLQSPQTSSSSKFYLGGLNSSLSKKEELLSSIKNYQVKTIHTLNSTRIASEPFDYSQEVSQTRSAYSLGSSAILLSAPSLPIEGFQPGYDTKKLDLVVSKIMSSHQSFTGARTDSFSSSMKLMDLTAQDNLLTSKVYESTAPQENKRKAPQQSRPAKKAPTVSTKQQRVAVNERKKQSKVEPKKIESCCTELEADGDSMILEFIKEKDQMLEDFVQEEARPAKRGREVEAEEFVVKKLSKRQEILNAKRQVKKDTGSEQPQKVRKESNTKGQTKRN